MANKVNTKVLSGFVELPPKQQAVFDAARNIVREVYESHGYMNTDTPAIERAEVLFAKSGGDTEKQIYGVVKEGHEGDMALRFDLTVPFARYVADHYGEIQFPFKRCQIDKSWRGERAQKGRYREFYQADVDVVAENDLPIAFDADVVLTLARALEKLSKKFGFGMFRSKLSSRKVWNNSGLKNLPEILALVDKRLKMPAAEFEQALSQFPEAGKVREILHDNGKDCAELQEVYGLLKAAGVPCEIDVSIVRGLDYYTGIVFETYLDDYPALGSVASGGRYANLVGDFSSKSIIGVGGSIGLSRLCVPLIEGGKFDAQAERATVIIPKTPAQNEAALLLSDKLAAKGTRAVAIYAGKEVRKPLELAAKRGAKFAKVIDEDGTITDKELT